MEHEDSSSDSRDDYRQGVRNRKIFTATDDKFGLPSNVAMGCGAAILGTFLLFNFWAAIVVALLVLPVMYRIHKDDPRALSLWQAAMFQPYTAWEAGTATRRELVILRRDSP